MNYTQTQLNALQRPKLLIRAARAGVQEFRVERDIRKIKGAAEQKSAAKLIDALFLEEFRLNEERLQNDPAYNVRSHIRALTALIVFADGLTPMQQAA